MGELYTEVIICMEHCAWGGRGGGGGGGGGGAILGILGSKYNLVFFTLLLFAG